MWQHLKTFCVYHNSLQIFHFCCIHGNEKEIQSHVAVRFIRGKADIKSLLGNAGNNVVNNCKPDHIIQNYYID
jgi:hypothetical protein